MDRIHLIAWKRHPTKHDGPYATELWRCSFLKTAPTMERAAALSAMTAECERAASAS